jgi:hypothetical protein
MSSASRLVLDEGNRPLTVREGNETREMPTIQAVLRAQVKSAVNGNPFAQKDLVNRFQKADTRRLAKIAEDCDYWEEYCSKGWSDIARAKLNGEAPPKFLPHPDDIKIDRENGVTIRGPLNEEDERTLERLVEWRNLLYMQGELDRRSWKSRATDEPMSKVSSAWVIAQLIDHGLPKRLQLSESDATTQVMNYTRMTKRTLLKTLHRGWRSLGMPVKRGKIFPRASEIVPQAIEDLRRRRHNGARSRLIVQRHSVRVICYAVRTPLRTSSRLSLDVIGVSITRGPRTIYCL